MILVLAGLAAGASLVRPPAAMPQPEPAAAPKPPAPAQEQAAKPGLPGNLERLIHESDRIVAVHSTKDMEGVKAFRVFKGPLTGPLDGDWQVKPPEENGRDARWVLFLRAEEDDRSGQPRLTGVTPEGWAVPYSDELAERIAAAVPLPAEWGAPQHGLRLGLRVRKPRVRVDEDVTVEVVLQNVGREEVTFDQHRYNFYDYWPSLEFEVTAPDGRRWTVERPEGEIKQADRPSVVTLKPGEAYIHTLRLNRWPVWRGGKDSRFNVAANLFADQGEYTVHCTWSPRGDKKELKQLTAAPVTVAVLADGLGAARLEDFRKNWKTFALYLTVCPQEDGKFDPKFELYHLALHVGDLPAEPPTLGPNGKPISARAKINAEQAVMLMTALAKRGFFDRARSHLASAEQRGKYADVSVGHGGTKSTTQLSATLPWDADLPRLLDALRACLRNSPAEQVLDRFRQPVAAAFPK
jgi:hypothetical protein